MKLLTAAPKREVSPSVRFLPAISIVMPFRPVTTLRKNLEYQLKSAMNKVEAMLIDRYPMEQAIPVIVRLKNLLASLNYQTHKKSIAIFISPVVEKVCYLEMEVEEKIVIDPSFKFSDVVACKYETKKFLVLQLSENYSKTYLCNSDRSQLIKFNVLHNFDKSASDEVRQFDSTEEGKQFAIQRFLLRMDQGLSIILQAYNFPVFVFGPIHLVRHFTTITKNDSGISAYMPARAASHLERELPDVTQTVSQNWDKLRQKHLIKKMQYAKNKNKLTTGIQDILRSKLRNRRTLLVLESELIEQPETLTGKGQMVKSDSCHFEIFFMKNEIDLIIKNVLEAGGEVEIVDKSIPGEFGQIALIQD